MGGEPEEKWYAANETYRAGSDIKTRDYYSRQIYGALAILLKDHHFEGGKLGLTLKADQQHPAGILVDIIASRYESVSIGTPAEKGITCTIKINGKLIASDFKFVIDREMKLENSQVRKWTQIMPYEPHIFTSFKFAIDPNTTLDPTWSKFFEGVRQRDYTLRTPKKEPQKMTY